IIINAIPTIDIMGSTLSNNFVLCLNNLLNNSPAPIGIMIIFTILQVMAKTSISMNSPASNFINKGVTKGAIKVAMEVIVSDNARLALAKYAITLEAIPLGE